MKKGYTIDLSKVGEAKQQITFPIREKVHLWHSNNVAVYQKFIRNFEKMSSTNIEFASKLFRLFADNMPKEAEEVAQEITEELAQSNQCLCANIGINRFSDDFHQTSVTVGF